MNQKEIQELIKLVAKQDIAEVKIKDKDFSITIRGKECFNKKSSVFATQPQHIVQAPATPLLSSQETVQQNSSDAEPPKAENKEASNNNHITIKSPMVGTFYRKPSPDKDVFVKVGDTISKGDVLCIIEAMKLFNEIESEISGTIVKVLVDDSTPVEYDQPLFIVEPA